MNIIKLKEVCEFLNNELKELKEDRIWICNYSGGNDSGGIESHNDDLLKRAGLIYHDEFLYFLEDQLLTPEYYSYAFEGSCSGDIFYNGKEFIAEGQESYEQWKDYKSSFNVLEELEENV